MISNGLPPALPARDAPCKVEEPDRPRFASIGVAHHTLLFVFSGLSQSGKVHCVTVLDSIHFQCHRSKLAANQGGFDPIAVSAINYFVVIESIPQ